MRGTVGVLPSRRGQGPSGSGLAVAGMAAFYWSGLASLLDAWSLPEYSHGYLIPLIALYLFLTRLGDRRDEDSVGVWPAVGVATVGLGLIVGLLGNLANIPDVTTYGLIICIGGLVVTTTGGRGRLGLLMPVAYLLFMLPLPNFVYWPLSIKLQLISSEIGVRVISLFGVPVYLDGNVIDLGVYKLQVAEACSGLRYLFPLMSFSFLFGVLYKGPVWHKVVLFLSALPITVFMNSFRIGVIGVLVDRYGIAQAEGFLHVFEGWIIFIACVIVLYLEAVLLQRLTRKPRSIHSMLEVDPAMLMHQLGRIRDLRASRALIAAAVAILVAAIAWQLVPARAGIAPERTPLALFPLDLQDWHGQRQVIDANIERVLAADDYMVADYSGSTPAPVDLLIAYYDSQTNGSGIHSPEVCIPAGGWEVSGWRGFETGLADGLRAAVDR